MNWFGDFDAATLREFIEGGCFSPLPYQQKKLRSPLIAMDDNWQEKSMKGLYVFYDRGAEDISPVFEAKTREVALRNFANAIRLSPFPEDYDLHQVAVIDYKEDIDSLIVTPENRLIANGKEVQDHIDKINSAFKSKIKEELGQ